MSTTTGFAQRMAYEAWLQWAELRCDEMIDLMAPHVDMSLCLLFGLARATPLTDDMRQMVDDLGAAGVVIERMPEPIEFRWV